MTPFEEMVDSLSGYENWPMCTGVLLPLWNKVYLSRMYSSIKLAFIFDVKL